MTADRFALRVAAAVAIVLGLEACTATETGNPAREQQLALTARSSNAGIELTHPGSGPSPDRIQVSEAWVVLGDLRFVQSASCDSGGGENIDVPGPTIAELVGEPIALPLALAATSYCRVRVPLERADDDADGIPVELRDHAILVRGTRADGVRFAIRSRQTREADIRSRGEPFALNSAEAALILTFDVGLWLQDVAFDELEPGDDGAIRIDDDENDEQLDAFEEQVERAMELFRDRDHDGRLTDDEAANPLASGGP